MKDRELAIDQFRGLAIFLMLPVNYLAHIHVVPWWLKHAKDVGLTIADFVAPFFIFAIGLTFRASVMRRREKEGLQKALEHTLKRALALIGLGALFTLGEQSYGFNSGQPWGTLQAIGAAIALTLPTLWLPWAARLGVAFGVLVGYQAMLAHGWLEVVLAASHAGLPGALSWAALLMIATVFADVRRSAGRFFGLAGSMLLAGLALALVVPISKHRMSASFDLVVSGTAALVFVATALLVKAKGPSSALVTWGQNPLVLYVSHLMLLSVFLVRAVVAHGSEPPDSVARRRGLHRGPPRVGEVPRAAADLRRALSPQKTEARRLRRVARPRSIRGTNGIRA